MAWPYATYARLHRLHHRWNGADARDPERTHPQPHPFANRSLLQGGVGLILETATQGWRLRSVDPRLDGAHRLDGAGVIVLHSLLLALAVQQGVLGRYLLF